MRILVLTPYLYGTAPGPRSSIELWERVLKPAGITFDYAPFESSGLHEILYQRGHVRGKCLEMLRAYGRRVRLMTRTEGYDAVLVYREAALIGPAFFERWVARRGIPIIYQLDDPLYVPYRSSVNGYLSYLKFFGKVAAICRLSRVVIVNSPQHQSFASRFARDVRLIPSLVDGERYRPQRRLSQPGEPVCIGWSGSTTTTGNLRVIADVLKEIAARPDARLHLIGADSFDLPGVRHSSQRWRAETEIDDLRQFDIGLLPVPSDEWTKRKFYLKLVQYMALGIPAVCTPLGATPDVVEDGVSGFLAEGSDAWREAIVSLIADPALRTRMGERASELAAERYTLEANAERIIAAVRAAAA